MYSNVECDAGYFKSFELLGWRRHAGDVTYRKRHRLGNVSFAHDMVSKVFGRNTLNTTRDRAVVCDI